MSAFSIAGRQIGADHPPYIIAEISANHNQDLDRALAIVEAAKKAGADAIKLQTYTPDTITFPSKRKEFQVDGTIWEGKSLYELYQDAYTPWEWHETIFKKARSLNMHAFSSPFDDTAVDFLTDLNVPAYKIASSELVDIPLLEKVASTGVPVILSTGMGTLSEIREAVDCLTEFGCPQISLLKCTASYPAKPEEANLKAIATLAKEFDCVIGLSDHTKGATVAVAAVALGAAIVEKHLTLKRSDG
ncbi:MAG: pseudaminic acid synthase, partial [Alphaproteobacteria bacterium]|nr:pseudaminic acid synthase [Alphaproteobacteria bacterium]